MCSRDRVLLSGMNEDVPCFMRVEDLINAGAEPLSLRGMALDPWHNSTRRQMDTNLSRLQHYLGIHSTYF